MTAAVLSPNEGVDADQPSGRRQDRRRPSLAGSVLLVPSLVLIVGGFLWPVIYSMYLGLTNIQLLGPHARFYQFTGLDNVKTMLHDPLFYQSLWLTAFFVVFSGVFLATAVGLAIALLMRHALPAIRGTVGGLVIVAWILPPVTTAILWVAATTTEGTVANLLGHPQLDLLDKYPLLVVCLANTWAQVGLAMLTFSAALRNVPREMEEAAVLEGAGAMRRFRSIVLPLLKPTIVTNVLLLTLLSLANFTLVYIMTQGGPNNATNILPVYSYQEGFAFYRLGYGALLGNVMVILAGIVGFLYVRASRVDR